MEEIARQADLTTVQSRPWVSSQLITLGDLKFDSEGNVSLYVVGKLINSGNSVALQAYPHLRLFAYAPTSDTSKQRKLFIEAQHALADYAKSESSHAGLTLAPKAEEPINQVIGGSHDEIAKAVGEFGAVWFAIIECVDYKFAFGPPLDHYQTVKIYDLFSKTNLGMLGLPFTVGRNVPANELGLGISFLGENYAT